MFDSRGAAGVWLLVIAMMIVLVVGVVAVTKLLPPKPLPPSAGEGEKPPEIRFIVVTDEEVQPLLSLEGAKLHFMPGNKIQVGYKSIPIQPTINCGVSAGMLWFSGIPSWIDLSRIDKNIDNYLSRWTPAWSFTVNTSTASATDIITPENEIRTANTTPTFDWADIADESGVKYSLEVDNDSDFSSPLITKSKIYSSSYTLTDEESLAEGSYYWRVMQRGKVWIIGMPPWLDISRYDPEVTKLPIILSIETGEGKATIGYMP